MSIFLKQNHLVLKGLAGMGVPSELEKFLKMLTLIPLLDFQD